MTAAQRRCAILIGRGLTYAESAKAIGVGARQVERWMSPTAGIPGMRELAAAEREQVYEPGALDTLRQLLSSESETIRLNAAKALLLQKPEDAVEDTRPTFDAYHVTMPLRNVYVLPDGTTTMIPPEGIEDEFIDPAATEVPASGDGMLPPSSEPDW